MPSMRLTVLVMCTVIFVASGCGDSKNSTTRATTTSAGNVTTNGTTSDASPGTTTSNAASSTGTSVPSTSTKLVTDANTICKHVHAQLMALTRGNNENAGYLYSRAAVYEQTALGELQKLNPPTDLASNWKQVIVAVSTLAEDSKKYAEYARAKNTSGANSLTQSYDVVKHAGAVAAVQDGLEECALAL